MPRCYPDQRVFELLQQLKSKTMRCNNNIQPTRWKFKKKPGWLGAIALAAVCLVALLAPSALGVGSSQGPYIFQPKNTVADTYKMTDIDAKVDTNDRMKAVGTWYDSANGDYALVLWNFENAGTTKSLQFAWKMNPTLTQEPYPRVWFRKDEVVVYFQNPSDSAIYIVYLVHNTNNIENGNVDYYKVDLPAAYQNDWKLGFVDEHIGIVGVKTGEFWLMVLKVKDGNMKCEKEQVGAGQPTLTCGSCGIQGNLDDDLTVCGAWDNKLQLMSFKRDCNDYRGDVQVTLPAGYTTNEWYFGDVNSERDGGKYYYAAIARKYNDANIAICYYVKEDDGSFSDQRAKEVTFTNSITYMKAQMDAKDGDEEPYYFFVTAPNQAVIIAFQKSGGTHSYLRYDLPTPLNAVDLSYMGFTMAGDQNENKKVLIVGQVTSYEDINGHLTNAVAKSGFMFGLDGVNSCVIFSDPQGPTTTESPASYLSTTETALGDDNTISDISPKTWTRQTLSKTTHYADTTFDVNVQYNDMTGQCTVPEVYPPAINDAYYVIHYTSYSKDWAYPAGTDFDFGPALFKAAPYNYAFDAWTHTAVLTGSGGTPATPTWSSLVQASDKIVITTTDTSLAGQYDYVITYSLNDPDDKNGSAPFSVYLIEIVKKAVNNMESAVGQPTDSIQTIVAGTPADTSQAEAWSLNPSTSSDGTLQTWTISYSIVEFDNGAAAPSWISYDSLNDEIVIDAATATTEGKYNFQLKGEAVDDTGTPTGYYNLEPFDVVIYSITAVAPADQIYALTTGADSYTFPAFTCTNCADTAHTITYSIVDGSGVDQTGVYPWLTIDSANRQIHYNTADNSFAGDYNFFIRGTLSDTHQTMDEIAWQLTLLTILPTVQDNLVYIIGDTVVLTEAIEDFTYSPNTVGPYTISYTVADQGGATIDGLGVTANTDPTPDDITVGLENDPGMSATYTIVLTGTLSHTSSITATQTFTLKLVNLAGTHTAQTYRIEAAGTTKKIPYTEATSEESTHTFTDYAVSYDGTTETVAPSWYTLSTTVDNEIEIATSDSNDAGVYTLAVKAVVDQRTSAWHYIEFQATLFTYTAQLNQFQVYTIGSGSQPFTITGPVQVPAASFTETCELYQSDGVSVAASTAPTSNWLTFDPATLTIDVNTATVGEAGEFDLKLKCTLDDDDASVEWTDIKYYLLTVHEQTQSPIVYLLGQTAIDIPINLFTYTPSNLPFDSAQEQWTYTLTHVSGTPTNVATVKSATGTDILVGDVASDNAGALTGSGEITDAAKGGSAVYQLTGQLSGNDSQGNAITAASSTTSFNIHIIVFTVTTTDVTFSAGTAAHLEPYTITHAPTVNESGDIPVFTYSDYQLLEDSTDTGVYGAQVYFGANLDTPNDQVIVDEPDITVGGLFKYKLQAEVDQLAGYLISDTFTVNVYRFYSVSTTTQQHITGANTMTYIPPEFILTNTNGFTAAQLVVDYTLTAADGSSMADYPWLVFDAPTREVQITTADPRDAGFYEFILTGQLHDPASSIDSTPLDIYIIHPYPVGLDSLFYLVGATGVTIESQLPYYFDPDLGAASNFAQSGLALKLYDFATTTYTGVVPTFIQYRSNQLYIRVQTTDNADIGYYRVQTLVTISDKYGFCSNDPDVTTEFTLIVFGMESQPLENLHQYIGYNPVLYDFPKFIQNPTPGGVIPALRVDYSLELVSTDNGLSNVDWQDFSYIYNDYAIVIRTDDETIAGNYTMNLVGTYSYAYGTQSMTLREQFVVELELPPRTFTVKPDHFYFEVDDHSMDYTEGWEMEIGGNSTIFGEYGNEMSIELNLGAAAEFVEYDKATKTIKIKEGAAKVTDVRTYEIEAFAHYANATYTEHYKTSFTLTIRNDNPIVPDDTEEITTIGAWTANNLTVRKSLELEPFNEKMPIPYIRDLTNTGVLVIGWDRPMNPPENKKMIRPSRVAVHNSNTTEPDPYSISNPDYFEEGDRRRLEYRYYKEMTNDEISPEWFLIVESLEIKTKPGTFSEPSYLNLTWDLLSYEEELIFIQLHFEYPDRISEKQDYDTLEVYFWGTEFFKSSEGEAVRFGTKLERKILRQVAPEQGVRVTWYAQVLSHLIWLVCIFSVLVSGRLLPTWMFLNSLQLVTHLVLFYSQMPPFAGLFLGQLLQTSRLNPVPSWIYMEKEFGYLMEGSFNVQLATYGYRSLYLSANLNFVLLIGLLVGGLFFLSLLKDLCKGSLSSCCRLRERFWFTRSTVWMTNFSVRYLYEVSLELFICAMISVAANRHPYRDDNVSSKEAKEALLTGVGGDVDLFNTIAGSIILTIVAIVFVVALSYGWQPLCQPFLRRYPHRTSKITHAGQEISQGCTRYFELRRHRREERLRIEREIKKAIARDSMAQGAIETLGKEKAEIAEVEDINQLMIMTPWVKDVQEPETKPHLVPIKGKPIIVPKSPSKNKEKLNDLDNLMESAPQEKEAIPYEYHKKTLDEIDDIYALDDYDNNMSSVGKRERKKFQSTTDIGSRFKIDSTNKLPSIATKLHKVKPSIDIVENIPDHVNPGYATPDLEDAGPYLPQLQYVTPRGRKGPNSGLVTSDRVASETNEDYNAYLHRQFVHTQENNTTDGVTDIQTPQTKAREGGRIQLSGAFELASQQPNNFKDSRSDGSVGIPTPRQRNQNRMHSGTFSLERDRSSLGAPGLRDHGKRIFNNFTIQTPVSQLSKDRASSLNRTDATPYNDGGNFDKDDGNKFKKNKMMIMEEHDVDQLEGGSPEFVDDLELYEGGDKDRGVAKVRGRRLSKSAIDQHENARLQALKRKLRTQAFFKQAKVDEMEAQIRYDSPAVKTLWFGIQFQSDSQSSILYPAFFLLRRAVFAALLIYGPQFAYWQIAILMYFSFGLLIVLVTRSIWKDNLITKMHIVNESVFIALCVFQIIFFPGVFPEAATASSTFRGIFVMVLVSAFVLFNLACIIYDAVQWAKQHHKRRNNIIEFRVKNRHSRVLINKRNIAMAKKLREIKNQIPPEDMAKKIRQEELRHRFQVITRKADFKKKDKAKKDIGDYNSKNTLFPSPQGMQESSMTRPDNLKTNYDDSYNYGDRSITQVQLLRGAASTIGTPMVTIQGYTQEADYYEPNSAVHTRLDESAIGGKVNDGGGQTILERLEDREVAVRRFEDSAQRSLIPQDGQAKLSNYHDQDLSHQVDRLYADYKQKFK